MLSKPAESSLFRLKFRHHPYARFWLSAAGVLILLGASPLYVSAKEKSAAVATEDDSCVKGEEAAYWTGEDIYNQCAAAADESSEEDEWDLGGDRYRADNDAMTEEDEAALGTLSDAEAQEVATLFDETDSDFETADEGSRADEPAAANDEPDDTPAQTDEGMGLNEGGADMAAAPSAEADGGAASGGDDGGFDSAEAGSSGADSTGTAQGTGSLIAVGVGEGLSEAIDDPTRLESVADVVVGTDPNQGSKENVVQVTALSGVTDGHLAVTVLEGIDGGADDPAAQLLAIDTDNTLSGPGNVPPLDGVAEVNVGDDPDGQSFNIVQLDIADENLVPDGGSLANVAVADGIDEGFGSLVGVSIAGENNGEHDNLADVALGNSFEPLADPLAPLTGGINDLGATLGGGLAPALGSLGAPLP